RRYCGACRCNFLAFLFSYLVILFGKPHQHNNEKSIGRDTASIFRLAKPGTAQHGSCCHRNRWDGSRGGTHPTRKRIPSSAVPTTAEQHRRIARPPTPKATSARNKKGNVPCIRGEGDGEGIEKRCNRNASEIDKQQANYDGSTALDANKRPIRGDEL